MLTNLVLTLCGQYGFSVTNLLESRILIQYLMHELCILLARYCTGRRIQIAVPKFLSMGVNSVLGLLHLVSAGGDGRRFTIICCLHLQERSMYLSISKEYDVMYICKRYICIYVEFSCWKMKAGIGD